MPGMSGLDVCEALKADPALASVPVVFATSHDPATLLQVTAFRKGASDFVTKPLIEAQLTARVRAHLRTKLQIEDLPEDALILPMSAVYLTAQPPGPAGRWLIERLRQCPSIT